jgi:hypothetical protein
MESCIPRPGKNVFIGDALIEAHQYGEALDWIGFCLAPSVEKKLLHDLPMEGRLNYRQLTDQAVLRCPQIDHLYAYHFNRMSLRNANPLREALLKMKATAPANAQGKYDNSVAFLDRWYRPITAPK